jgi:predicted nucleic acid-binding protein
VAVLYAIDTNLYIRALRDAEELARLKRFLLRVGTRLRVAGVVALELRAGARSDSHRAAVESLLAPYAARGRVITPSFEAFVEAGRALAALVERERLVLAAAAPSFRYDVLLAASCREAGVVLLTANHGDFTRIKRHLRGFHFESRWPTGSTGSGL